MAQLSKQAAKKANHVLDAAASVITANAAAFGIKPEIAEKFAFQCDLIADHIAKQAGVDLTKLAAQRKQGLTGDDVFDEGLLGYDPEEIGEEVKGPEEHDADESYMSDKFTQQWNRELREKQEGGDLGDTPSPEPQTPRPGVQASKLASISSGISQAAVRCASAKNAGMQNLSRYLIAAGDSVLQFQARALEGKESAERVETVLTAAGHVLPHLASISPDNASKVAQMASILSGLAQG